MHTENSAPLPHHELTEEILNLKAGDHLCLFYDNDPAEQMPTLLPFIRDGLAANEQFIYIADDQTTETLAAHLERGGINVSEEIAMGRLKLWTRGEWRPADKLSSERMAATIRRIFDESVEAGFEGARFAVEMTWTLGPDIDVELLEHWEATINTIFSPRTNGRIICQYNRSRMSPKALVAALYTHPKAIIENRVHANSFFEAPLILEGNGGVSQPGLAQEKDALTARLDWMISQLKQSRRSTAERESHIRETANFLVNQQTARTLEESDQEIRRYAAIVESSDDAIISKDLNGVITSWNRGAELLYGYKADEVIGKPVLILIPDDRQDEEPNILGRIQRGERIDHYETVRQRKDGSLVDISLTVSPVFDRSGRIVGASKIARDISERRRSEETLRLQHQLLIDADQRKNEFLAMLGHELRNPLAAIQNAAELLREGNNPESTHWAATVVRRQTAQLSRLVDDLVDVARITCGRIELRRDNIDVAPVVRRVVETARPIMLERRHALNVALPEERLLVCADSARLEQLLVNLLTNAAKYTDAGGQIELSLSRSDEEAVITVSDNGIGIAPNLLPHIFDLFVQEPRGLDRSRGGLGLGLALARRLAEMHGGILTARSDGPGKGSEFSLRLPLLPEGAVVTPESTSQLNGINYVSPKRPVLIVDDNSDSANGLRRLLERRGHSVRVAHDSTEALQLVTRFKPEAFLLDLGLPGMDGYKLAEELRKAGFQDALFVAISGYAQTHDLEMSRRAGFQHHLAKPVELATVLKVLGQAPAEASRSEVSRPNADLAHSAAHA